MPSSNSSENLLHEPHREQESPEKSPLTPELEGFIKRTLVPLLVQSYIDDKKKKAKDTA